MYSLLSASILKIIEQTFKLLVIWHTITLMWCHCNECMRFQQPGYFDFLSPVRPHVTMSNILDIVDWLAKHFSKSLPETISSTVLLARYQWYHDDVIKWKYFPLYWPFVRGIHWLPVNSPYKGQWCRALMLPLICPWINSWVNNREAGDLRCHRAHYDITVMLIYLQVQWWPSSGPIRAHNCRLMVCRKQW